MNTWRIALMAALVPVTLGASTLVVGCNDDVDTPPWYPNYTDSGYGGAKGGSGGAAGAKAGAAGIGAAGASPGGDAGEGGAP